MMNAHSYRPGWLQAGLALAVLLASVLLLYRGTALHVVAVWNRWDSGYSHGYLVLAISGYLVFRLRRVLGSLVPCPSSTALWAVAATSLLWLIAMVAGVLMVQIVALLLLLLAVIWVACGDRLARHLAFPVLLVAFALPVWSPLLPFLQHMTADAVYSIARLLALPVLRQEHVIVLPAGRLAISESCSGLSYLLAALTLGVLYAYLNYRRLWSRLLVVLAVAVAALLANILRVIIVVYLAYKTDMQHPLVDDHFNLGWYLFGGLVLALLLVETWLSHHPGSIETTGLHAAARDAEKCSAGFWRHMLLLAAALLLAASGPSTARWAHNRVAQTDAGELVLPAGRGGWVASSAAHDDWMPVYHGAVVGKQAYRKEGHELYLYIGYYPVQTQGSELISDLNRLGDGKLWAMQYLHGRPVAGGGMRVLEQQLVSASGSQRLVWYWYRVAGRDTTNGYLAKGLQLLGFVSGQTQAALLAVAADAGADAAQARQILDEFLSAMRPALKQVAGGHFN